jgi:hypothetical protein
MTRVQHDHIQMTGGRYLTISFPSTISGIKIQGSDSIDFTETTDCGLTIEAGATCTLSLVFKPKASGTRSGTLTMDGTGQKIFLTGVGK